MMRTTRNYAIAARAHSGALDHRLRERRSRGPKWYRQFAREDEQHPTYWDHIILGSVGDAVPNTDGISGAGSQYDGTGSLHYEGCHRSTRIRT